jgi:hypothetical protein
LVAAKGLHWVIVRIVLGFRDTFNAITVVGHHTRGCPSGRV